jgi:hypothetical protein
MIVQKRWLPASILFVLTVLAIAASRRETLAQEGAPNPTPIVISLTPTTATPASEATPTATPDNTLAPDRFEPNDDAASATTIGFQNESGLTLVGGDVDAFTGFLKAGQILQVSTTVYGQLDTRIDLYWAEQLVAENDDRGPADLGSSLSFVAPAEGWYVAVVTKAGSLADGVYDLQTTLLEPTATPTLLPTLTPSPTSTATPTMTPSATPTFQPDAAEHATSALPAGPSIPWAATMTPTATATATATMTVTERISLTVRHLGRVAPQSDTPVTSVRLLVYYDANNDRAPGPGEGIPNVSVLAVDALGQRLAQVFTNAQGEATFNLHDQAAASVARIIVPFVPAWSAPVRVGQANDDIVLGLPAVRLPVFFPVSRDDVSDGE